MLEPQLDHPSCHPVKGWFRASGEWEASDDVTIYLTATGRGNGIGIDWDYEIESVETFVGFYAEYSAYSDQQGNAANGLDWRNGEPIDISKTSYLWMLGVAFCWAIQSADKWANKNAEGLAQ